MTWTLGRGKALLVLVVGVATIACGCAHPDWIESTLVTVDVSGTWVGTFTAGGGDTRGDVTLTLQQSGTKVTGNVKVVAAPRPGPAMIGEEITGTVNGDVLRARSTSGRLQVELTVAGSEMAGPGSAYGRPGQFVLRQPDVVPSSR
jgi:hypothetical protein